MIRLIDISRPDRVKFVEIVDPSNVRYAILSHVWNKNDGGDFTPEPTFQDLSLAMQTPGALPEVPKFAKLLGFFRTAAKGGLNLVWADMCCIDKTSSAEVSEAIASMFFWYTCAEVCYAYLKDVPSPVRTFDALPLPPPAQFSQSMWFKRGWPLQELVASKSLVFLSEDWKIIGTKRGLARLVQGITHIDVDVLTHRRKLHEVSVACRMSWAANRTTERPEDRAYSLMGIFGVRIPVLYGEREYAFVRLQEEILRRIPDPTLLAWGPQRPLSSLSVELLSPKRAPLDVQTVHVRARPEQFSSLADGDSGYLFAPSPDAFHQTARLASTPQQFGPVSIATSRTVLRGGGPSRQNIVPFHMLQMHVPLVPLAARARTSAERGVSESEALYLVPLGCSTSNGEPIALLLCPGPSLRTSNSLSEDRPHWVIGFSIADTHDTAHHCRIVTLPSPNCSAEENGVLRRWEESIARMPDRELYLPLSAPLDHWRAGDPRRAATAEDLLRENKGHFEIHLSEWCKSALESAGFTVDMTSPSARNPTHSIGLIPPPGYTLCVRHGDRPVAVEAFEVTFANCPIRPRGLSPEDASKDSTFPLVGSITPHTVANALNTVSTAEKQLCSSCSIATDDHIGTSQSWSLHGGVAVRTLGIKGRSPVGRSPEVHRALKSFTLSVTLRAVLPLPPCELGTSPQAYLLEIEFFAVNPTPSSNTALATGSTGTTKNRRRISSQTASAPGTELSRATSADMAAPNPSTRETSRNSKADTVSGRGLAHSAF